MTMWTQYYRNVDFSVFKILPFLGRQGQNCLSCNELLWGRTILNGMALKLKTMTVYDISLPDDHWKNMPMVSFDFLQMGFVILVKNLLELVD